MLWATILEPLAEIFMPILQKLKTHHKYLALSILFVISLVLYYFGQNTELLLELLPLLILAMVFLGYLIYKK